MVAEQLPASEGAMGAMFKGVERDRGIAHLHDVRGHTFRPKALVGRIEALLGQSGDGAAPAVGTILKRVGQTPSKDQTNRWCAKFSFG